jgi:hypothetical protein
LASITNTLSVIRGFATTIDELDGEELTTLGKNPNNDTAVVFMEERMMYSAEVCRSLLGQAEYIQKVDGTMIQVAS